MDNNEENIKLSKGNILDIGGSIRLPDDAMPVDFKKVRKKVEEEISKPFLKTTNSNQDEHNRNITP